MEIITDNIGKLKYYNAIMLPLIIFTSLAINQCPTPLENVEEDRFEDRFVVRAIDGDTIELENGEIVRYIGVDAP